MNGDDFDYDIVATVEKCFLCSGVYYKKQQNLIQEIAGEIEENYEMR